MTYAANTAVPTQVARTFVILRPKRRVEGWTVYSGNTWEASFDYGRITRVFIDGTEAVLGTTLPLSSGEYLYDADLEKLYVHSTTDPDTKFVVVFYELLISTQPGYWYRDPMDSSTPEVYWEGLLSETPRWSQQVSDLLFGFFPIEASGLSISNGLSFFDRHVHDTSWHKGQILVYHQLGDATVANVREVFTGFTRNIGWVNTDFSIEVDSLFRIFDTPYKTQKYFSSSDFANVDPDAVVDGDEWPIRKVYGRVDGFSPVNVQYDATPGTTVNRTWIVSQGQTFKADLTKTINAAGTNDATHSEFTNVDGLMTGDSIYLSDVSVGAEITGIAGLIVTHTSVGARGVLAGATGLRQWLGFVKIWDRNGVSHNLMPQHWTAANFANGSKGFTLDDNFEAAIGGGFPAIFDPDQDKIQCRVYGETFIQTYSVAATPVTTVSTSGGNLNNIAAIIYNLIREVTAFQPATIDETSFQAAVTGRTDIVGFTIPPEKTQHDYPTYKELLQELIRTGLMRLQINDFSGRAGIGISLMAPLATPADASIDSTQFTEFQHSLGYEDVYSQVRVKFKNQDITTGINVDRPRFSLSTSAAVSSALYLHEVDRTLQIDTLHILPSEAVVYATRAGYLLSERRGVVRMTGKNDFILAELGETYQVEREALPGYAFERGTLRTRKYVLAESEKSTRKVVVRLEDQKGIEDNSGSW